MTRLAIQLPAVQTVARVCTNPGSPGRGSDPGLVQLYRAAPAERRDVSPAQPRVSVRLRDATPVRHHAQRLGDRALRQLEIASGTSAKSWKYEAGKMVFERTTTIDEHAPADARHLRRGQLSRRRTASTYGGHGRGRRASRSSAWTSRPDSRIREPDVSGSIYLDPATLPDPPLGRRAVEGAVSPERPDDGTHRARRTSPRSCPAFRSSARSGPR